MSNELIVSENSGAAGAGSATEGLTGGGERAGFASLPANPTRKAEIERIMKDDFDLYERSGLNREYLALLQAEQYGINPDSVNPTVPMDAGESRNSLCSSEAGRKLVSDWDSLGGFKAHLANVQRDVADMVRSLGSYRAQRVFMEHFDREVPEPARLAVYGEIAAGRNAYVAPAAPSEIKHFAATPAGGMLVAEWGTSASENVAMLKARAKRINDALDEDDAHEFWYWLDNLDAATAATIFRKMAG